jgi:hypothetical protein
MFFISLLLFFFQGTTFQLSETPLKENATKLEHKVDIVDDGDGFYRSIDSAISPDGRVVILDRGNYLIHIYSKNGKKLHSFGKEGNGPGELSRAGRIKALHSHIILVNFNRVIIFNYKGELIKEIKGRYLSAAFQFTKTDFSFHFPATNPSPYSKVSFNLDGDILQEVKNSSGIEATNYNTMEMEERLKRFFHDPKQYVIYGDKFVQRVQGAYKFIYVNKNGDVLKDFRRNYERISGNLPVPIRIRSEGNISNEQKKQIAKMRENVAKQQQMLTGGFKNDIVEIIGVLDNYLLLHVASEDDSLWKVDIISPDNIYYTSFIYEHEDLDALQISNNQLIAECSNDDIGPYIKIFDLNIL